MSYTCKTNWPTKNGIRIGHLNINRILNKFTQVPTILSNSDTNFHVFGFSETWLTDNSTDESLAIAGYNTERRDAKESIEKGLLVYVNQNITYKRLRHLERFKIECIWLEVKIKRHSPILILLAFAIEIQNNGSVGPTSSHPSWMLLV